MMASSIKTKVLAELVFGESAKIGSPNWHLLSSAILIRISSANPQLLHFNVGQRKVKIRSPVILDVELE